MGDKENHISFRPSDRNSTLKKDLQKMAKADGRTLNNFLEKICVYFIKNSKKKK